jgi:cytoskeletal protein CcmA (bactofilin family)
MWKKDQTSEPMPAPLPEPIRGIEPREPRGIEPRPPERAPAGERATIGRSITIRGEVTGDEDLLIQGRIEGSVQLAQHAITVGPQGEVQADIVARVVIVEGNVEGNLSATEQVVLQSTARVLGDITAPRVLLEDGAYFRGGVDMGRTLTKEGPTSTARPTASGSPASARPNGAIGEASGGSEKVGEKGAGKSTGHGAMAEAVK